MGELIKQYVEGLPEQVTMLMNLLREANLETLRREVHKIKGAGGGYGFSELTDLAAKAEKRIRAGAGLGEVTAEIRALVTRMRSVDGYQGAKETGGGK